MVEQGAAIKAVAEAFDGDVVLAMEKAQGVADAIEKAMGVAGDDSMQLCVSVMSYMEGILQDEELMDYIDYKSEVELMAEEAAKMRNVFELMA